MKYAVMLFGVLVAVAAAAALRFFPGQMSGECADVTMPSSPEFQTADMRQKAIADEIPGFRGMVWDPSKAEVLVYVDDPSAVSLEMIQPALARHFGVATLAGSEIRLSPGGRYPMGQVLAWYECIRNEPLPGTVLRGVDQARAQIFLGVIDDASQGAVEVELEKLGVPRDAVYIEITGRVVPE